MSDDVHAKFSLDRELLAQFDQYVARSGLGTRSEAMRELIQARLESQDDAQASHAHPVNIRATVTLVLDGADAGPEDHSAAAIARRAPQVVASRLHFRMNSQVCIEVILLRGPLAEVQDLADALIDVEDVHHGHAIFGTLGLPLAMRHGM